MFALAYVRHILGRELAEANPLFERLAQDQGFYSGQLMAEVARTGTVRQFPGLPPGVRAAFVTALEIAPAWHLKMQAAVQRCRSTTPTAAAATRTSANSDPSGRPAQGAGKTSARETLVPTAPGGPPTVESMNGSAAGGSS